MDEDTGIHFGAAFKDLLDWREVDILDDENDNDEDEPATKDLKSILGFNPDNIDYGEE